MLIAIEGIDGAGKNTVGTQLKAILIERGLSVDIIQFPQYESTYGGRALGDFLAGRHPIPEDVKVVAALYAIDRLEYLDSLYSYLKSNDIIIFDRYIGSNLAFQAAKADPKTIRSLLQWIISLEVDTFGLPVPNLNVLLRTHVIQAKLNVLEKASRNYTSEAFDVHERDDSLQHRAQHMYELIANETLLGPWLIIDTRSDDGSRKTPREMALQIADYVNPGSGL